MKLSLPGINIYLFYLVKIILYVLIIFSIVLMFGNDMIAVINSFRKKSVFRKENEKRSNIYMHIEKIFYVLYGANNEKRIYNFFMLSVAFFFVPFLLLRDKVNFTTNLLISSFLLFLPYIYLRLNLYKIRVESSFDAEKVVSEISNQYKIANYNMSEAIRRSERYLASAPYSRRQIYSLALILDVYRTDEELKKYLDYFVYSINTQWAKMLSNNIYFAVSKDLNVSEGLTDILKDIRNAHEANEKANRENTESYFMVFFLAPLLLILSPFLANKLLGFSLSKFFQYQFNTPIGVSLFVMIFITLVIDLFIVYFLRRKKFDI